MIDTTTLVAFLLAILVVVVFFKIVRVVPQQSAFVVERLGQYKETLEAGWHLLVPFMDRVAYDHSLKEESKDIPPQDCVTQDNVVIKVDGVLYYQIIDAQKASYGSNNPLPSIIALSQTTTRSVIGKKDLEDTFSARDVINQEVITAVDQAAEPWGYKILRYEINSITPPARTLEAMEKLVAADREKRAVILRSEGERQRVINEAEAAKAEVVMASEADKQKQINESEGEAKAIIAVGDATAEALKKVADAIQTEGGDKAMELRVAEQWVIEFGKLAKESTNLVIPTDLSNLGSMLAAARTITESTGSGRS